MVDASAAGVADSLWGQLGTIPDRRGRKGR